MRVRVDDDICAGHGVCVATCPEVFRLTADGFSEVLVDVVPAEHVEAARTAVEQCPEHAIEMEID
ncbi:ferredoxin [Aldersonia sp. NBC_00410]|uniref:ferredoxin n=1 Tax=Aldersonia sp. NBC_00410 TaxID=2975954 RepID=UPI00225AA8A9|nr:ferredoxin [Aldersonia sp. NBC_00410]MCX5044729.1 ferredoxin [Aldersonia sp. NBC_00410]